MADRKQELRQLSVANLRDELEKIGLSSKGKKETLIKRLVAFETMNELAHTFEETENNEESHVNVVESNPQSTNSSTSTQNDAQAVKIEPISQESEQLKRKLKILHGDVESLALVIKELSENSKNKIKVQMRLQRLNECRVSCLDLRELFAFLTDETNTEIQDCNNLLNYIDGAIDIAQEYIENITICKSSENSSCKEQRQNLKLPKLELPTFSGDLLKFSNFWDQYEAAVHTNDTLPEVQKFTYLRSVLRGDALRTVEGFEVTGANYIPAVEALKHRYGRQRIIISSLVKSVVNLESASSSSAQSLRKLYDTLKNRTRALEALGEDPTAHACILLPIFETKLPPLLLEKWELELADIKDEEIDLELYFKFLNRHLVSKEAGERNHQSTSIDHSHLKLKAERKPGFNHRREKPSTSSNLFADTTCNSIPSTTSVCPHCNLSHELFNCPEFKKATVDERWTIVKTNKLCYNCLKPSHAKHFSKNCRQPKCSVNECAKRHHNLLHQQSSPTISGFASTSLKKPMETLLPTAIAKLSANGQTLTARVLLDTGSQRSCIRKNFAESIGLKGPTESVSFGTLGGNTSETKRVQRVKFSLSALKDNPLNQAVTIEALAIPKICNPLGPVKLNFNENPHLRNLNFADTYPRDSVDVDVLIGADYYYSFVTGNCKRGKPPNTATAVETILGWVLTGPIESKSETVTTMFAVTENSEITKTLKRFWELEAIGISKEESAVQSKDEQRAIEDFNYGLKFDGSNYEVRLPWKPGQRNLNDNYGQALQRLEGIERKLKRDPTKAKAYTEAINQYAEKGFAEEVPDDEKQCAKARYLPHHAVFRNDKSTTKCRIVFDASAKDEQGASLNDCILPGPALQPNLASVLTRFRTHKIGLLADVEKMFLQIKLAKEDRDVHRYLWREIKSDELPRVYRMNRLTFGVNCSPFLAIATIHAHATGYLETFPLAANELLNNMYVDDCLTGVETDEEALKLKHELTDIMKAAAFNLTKWASNSESLMNSTEPEQRSPTTLLDLSTEESLKALGVSWDLKSDCFKFIPPDKVIAASCSQATKRTLLSLASRVFDPLGLISPFTVRVKILFQELWRRGLDWDDPLDEDVQREWSSWQSELPAIRSVDIPRCFGDGINHNSQVELHGFGDASPKAYGAAVYIRITDEKGRTTAQLVMSKSRVAPIKTVSLPRLELLAAVVNARLITYISETLTVKPNRIVCYTDSMVVLYWIRRLSASWKPFVANRVAEIQALCDPEYWKYCPSKENPADLLTRGIPCTTMATSKLWWSGPSWLSLPVENQPSVLKAANQEMPEECCVERRSVHACPSVVSKPMFDMNRRETWLKVKRITAYILKAVRLFKTKTKSSEAELTTDELKKAELKCYQWIQQEIYQEEYALLKSGKPVPNKSRILKLDPYFDEDEQLIKVGGRLQYSDVSETIKHPIILPHGHPVVEKIILDTHKHLLHAGPETVLSTLRQNIWLTQGRREVKRVLRRCVTCQKQKVKSCAQKMGPLPAERVTPSLPFTHIGIDFAGPLSIKEGSTTKKAYICIFTCASSRMVHLELTESLSTDEFLQAFSRMINRRGVCATIWSDNAKTFKAASNEVKRLYKGSTINCKRVLPDTLDEDRIKAEMTSRGIQWKFITERSPWRGGWWERMVRSIKEPLRKILGRALLTYSELNTLIIKIEGVINSRPLTAVGDDPRDLLPITPAQLAIGRQLHSVPPSQEDYKKESSKRTNERYLYLLRLLNQYWTRWQKEYVCQLNVRNKWLKEEVPVSVGDIVMVSEDNLSRMKWSLAKVEEVHPGKDGLIRTVTVKTERGIFNRPVQRLHKLEIESCRSQQHKKRDFSSDGGETISKGQSSPNESDVVLPSEGQGGEDVPAQYSRVGRRIKRPKKLDL